MSDIYICMWYLPAGAMYIDDFRRLCRDAGFSDPLAVSTTVLEVKDRDLSEVTIAARENQYTINCQSLPLY